MNRGQSNFIDHVRLLVKGGSGAAGHHKWRSKGGNGGNVFFKVEEHMSLSNLINKYPKNRIKAESGHESGRRRLVGINGNDTVVPVPAGITVSLVNGHEIGQLDTVGQSLLIAKGGLGGGPYNDYLGQRGQQFMLHLDLKLLADYGFVGFPNAGKSTLMSAISRASPKIAEYPFTTLKPSLATINYEDHRQITIADLPGLIEGAHVNVGLGHHFLKHVERTKCLLFVVDTQGFQFNQNAPYRDPVETVLLLNKELELYKPELIRKPALCILNKIDLLDSEKEADELSEKIQHLDSYAKSLNPDENMRPENIIKFDEIFSISAKEKINTDNVKSRLRFWLDEYASRAMKEAEKENNEMLQKLDSEFEEHFKSVI